MSITDVSAGEVGLRWIDYLVTADR